LRPVDDVNDFWRDYKIRESNMVLDEAPLLV